VEIAGYFSAITKDILSAMNPHKNKIIKPSARAWRCRAGHRSTTRGRKEVRMVFFGRVFIPRADESGDSNPNKLINTVQLISQAVRHSGTFLQHSRPEPFEPAFSEL